MLFVSFHHPLLFRRINPVRLIEAYPISSINNILDWLCTPRSHFILSSNHTHRIFFSPTHFHFTRTAAKEKELGNESYGKGLFADAIVHYTAAIGLTASKDSEMAILHSNRFPPPPNA